MFGKKPGATKPGKEDMAKRQRVLGAAEKSFEALTSEIANAGIEKTRLRDELARLSETAKADKRRLLLDIFKVELIIDEDKLKRDLSHDLLNGDGEPTAISPNLTERLQALQAQKQNRIDQRKAELLTEYPDLPPLPPPQPTGPQTFADFVELLGQYPFAPETDVFGPPGKQRALLGVFHKDGDENRWPVLRRGEDYRIDLEFEPSLIGGIRPAAQQLLELFEAADPRHFLLLAVSGGGKTSVFADLARSQYVLYVQCAPFSTDATPSGLQRRSRTYDFGFASMLESVHRALGPDVHKNVDEARRLFAIELLIRLAQLYKLVQIKTDVTPFQFYVHQRNVGNEWLELLRPELRDLTLAQCIMFFREMRTRLDSHFGGARLVIAIDELEAAAAEWTTSFDVDREKKKGLLAPMGQAIAALETGGRFRAIFAGTGTSLKRKATIVSSLNKASDLEVVASIPQIFPTVTRDACMRFFSKLNVTLDEVPAEAARFNFNFTLEDADNRDSSSEELLGYFVIGSRYRTLTRILNNIVDAAPLKNLPAQAVGVLREAIRKSIKTLSDDLDTHITKVIKDRDLHGTLRDQFLGYLTQIWTALALNGGRAQILSSTADEDLMALGVGNFSSDRDEGYFEVTEYIVAEALRRFLEKNHRDASESQFRQALAVLQRLVQVHGNVPARGTTLEHLVFVALLQPEFQETVVSNLPFIAPFERQRLAEEKSGPKTRGRSSRTLASDPWWNRTVFKAKHVLYHHDLEEGITTSSFLASDGAREIVYSPETVARFDGVLKLDATHALNLALTIWSGNVPTDKIHSQIRSTDLSKAYFRTDGTEVNPTCISQREQWTRAGLDGIRCVRVHLALPTFTKNAVLGVPLPGDELGVHLDQTNCHLLFGKGETPDMVYEVLAIATNTKLSSWPGHTSNT